MEIKGAEVYRLSEAKEYLKVSTSTLLRMIRKGILRSVKIGKQYRILGRELIRIVSPDSAEKEEEKTWRD